MTVINKNDVRQFFRRKLGRDPFSNGKLRVAHARGAGLPTNHRRKGLQRRLM